MYLEKLTYEGKINFLSSSHIVFKTGGLTLDCTKVEADDDGNKIIPAGSFIGENSVSGKGEVYAAAVAATLNTGVEGDNNAITWTARTPGALAPSIALVDPSGNSQPLSVTVNGNTVTVSLATGESGAITSTAEDVIKAVSQNYAADNHLYGQNTGESTGAGVVTAIAESPLEDGSDANVTPEWILFEEADLTKGDIEAGMFYQGAVIESRLPAAPDSVVKANMPMIKFD